MYLLNIRVHPGAYRAPIGDNGRLILCIAYLASIHDPQTFSIRSRAIFLPFMTFIKTCFQSEILRTVNSISSFNFVHLAKYYGALHFTDSIQ